MTLKKLLQGTATLGLLASLAACGGGGGGGESLVDNFSQSYGSALAGTTSASGVANPALKESFDDRFLDAGYTKTQVVANLDADAQAISASPDYSLFPQLQLTDTSVSNCGSDGVCTLSGNLTNNDADATTVPFSVRVIQTPSGYRLYGDQKTS